MWAVPMIASVLAFGNYYALNQLVGNAAGGEQSIANQAAGEAVSGNYSANNMQIGNESVYNENAFKSDTNFSYLRGQVSTQSDSGALVTHLGDGKDSIQSGVAMTNIPQKLSMSNLQHSELDRRFQESVSDAQQDIKSYHESATAAYQNMFDLSEHMANSENIDGTITAGDSYNNREAFNTTDNLIEKFSKEHGINKEESKSIIAGVAGDLSVSASLGPLSAHGKIYAQGEAGAALRENQTFHDAKELVQSADFQNSIDKIKHSVKEDHYRGSDEVSGRLSDSISSNLTHASEASSLAQVSIEKSENYQRGIQYSDSHASQIEVEKSSDFVNWLKDQEDITTGQSIGINKVTDIVHNQPEEAREFAEQYMKQLPDHKILPQTEAMIDVKQSNIEKNYEANKDKISGIENVNQKHTENMNRVASNEKAQEVYQKASSSLDENKAKKVYEKDNKNSERLLDRSQFDQDSKALSGSIRHNIKRASKNPISEVLRPVKYDDGKDKK